MTLNKVENTENQGRISYYWNMPKTGVKEKTMGTLPVFMTAISTILGAILYLRFGYAVGNVGLVGTLLIIVLGHLVTVPTAMAVAEIATNQKVEGGGAYFMISRSFGLNIGAAIGIALYLSQAISIAFYVIAFTVSFEPVAAIIGTEYGIYLSPKIVGLSTMALLLLLMATKGADLGVKALYAVVFIITISLVLFFAGHQYSEPATFPWETTFQPDSFFKVFTIIFPAFTGIAAGLGLSGDLKEPRKSIPKGTMWATAVGIVVYIMVAMKLFYSASPEDLANTDILIMEKIAVWGPIIPIGLAAAAISSALGSIMIAPRTLQALGVDNIFPAKLNELFSKGRKRDNEPVNALLITSLIGFFFIAIGDIDFVAEIISMFFMVTYGAICAISFLEHFGGNPSYRPTFHSKWYLSLLGAVLCFFLMFQMNSPYAALSLGIMILIYFFVRGANKADDFGELMKGVVFQLNRTLQVYLQQRDSELEEDTWRPFIISISKDTFQRKSALDFTSWLSYKYGFGTYMHYIEGFLNKESYSRAKEVKNKLVKIVEDIDSKVFLDTIISPSITSALAQSIQLSGVSGKGNNLILFEYDRHDMSMLEQFMKNYNLMNATEFDVCVLKSTTGGFGHYKDVQVWISPEDVQNANLMILLAYILLGHPTWKNAQIRINSICVDGQVQQKRIEMEKIIQAGRLPISSQNLHMVEVQEHENRKQIITQTSENADLTIIGFEDHQVIENWEEIFNGYDKLGNILFVNAFEEKQLVTDED